MAFNLKIDFTNRYEIQNISDDFRESIFISVLFDERNIELKVDISDQPHELLTDVYNLSFGPIKPNGRIDDKTGLNHKDYAKTFSTILFNGLTYLTANPSHFLGVDGSDNTRAYLYYRTLQHNYDYLSKHFLFLV